MENFAYSILIKKYSFIMLIVYFIDINEFVDYSNVYKNKLYIS